MTTAGRGTADTATVLFTDLVSSTETRSQLGAERADDVRRRHDDALRSVVDRHGGTVVKGLGDGIMATFSSAADGVAAAVAAQQAIARLSQTLDGPTLAIRVGISAGDVAWEDGDAFGEPVIEASRLCAAAAGGQILASEIVRLLARNRGGHQLVAIGELRLKGLPEPVAAFEVSWQPSGPDIPLPAALRTRQPFSYVGRVQEREALSRAWKQAIAGQAAAVLVAGEPGVGKTRLVAQLAEAAREESATVVAGGCDEQVNFPFQPIVEALRHFLAHCPADERQSRLGPHAAELARLVPEIAEFADVDGGLTPALDEDSERLRVFEAVATWLASAGAGGPVLLVLDDLHWADSATVLLLRHLVRRNAAERVLIVGTYRDTDVDRRHPLAATLADLRREPGVHRIRLRGLNGEEVASFVESAAGHDLDASGAALAARLHDETEGNPFFLEEVLLHLIETGTIYQGADGRWTSDRASVEALGIPEGVREVVGRRVSLLSQECNDLLAVAAAIGSSFELAVLRSLVEDSTGLVEAMEEAERAGLLAEGPGASGSYVFTHALVRQTLLEELSLARRQQHHLRIAQALQQSSRANAASVAFHYRAAGAAADPDQAVTACLIAADEARRHLAWEEASDHWEAALELLEVTADNPGRTARLLELLGDAMYATARDWQKGIDQLQRAAAIYDDIGDAVAGAKVRVKVGRNLSTFPDRADIRRAFENYDQAERVLGQRPRSASYGYLLIGKSTAHTFQANPVAGEATAAAALEIAEEVGNETLRSNAELLLGWHRGSLGYIDDGLAIISQARDRSIEHGNPVLAFLGSWLAAGLFQNVTDFVGAAAAIDEELASGRLDGAPGFRTAALHNKAASLLYTGQLREAKELHATLPALNSLDAAFEWAAGDWNTAATMFAELRDITRSAGNHWNAALFSFQMANCLECIGDFDSAIKENAQLLELPWAAQCAVLMWPVIGLTAISALKGERDAAAKYGARCAQWLEKYPSAHGMDADLLLGASYATPDIAEAEARMIRAAEVARQYSNPWVEANVLQHRGRLTRRPEHIDEAIRIYEDIGAGRPWIDRALEMRAGL